MQIFKGLEKRVYYNCERNVADTIEGFVLENASGGNHFEKMSFV